MQWHPTTSDNTDQGQFKASQQHRALPCIVWIRQAENLYQSVGHV